MPAETPSAIGRYDIRRELRREPGGVITYLACDARLERDINLQLLPLAWSEDEERSGRFEGDVRVVAAIDEPHVATIHSLERDGDRLFLTMEYVPGRTLREAIGDSPPSLETALSYIEQISEAIVAAHHRSLLHRGLDLDRVIVTADGVAKVTGFGLGVPEGNAIDDPESVGASEFTSPEQLAGETPDVRSDVYAFAAIALACLAGRSPFAGDSLAARISSARDAGVDSELVLPGELPPTLRSMLITATSVDPAARPTDMTVVRDEVRRAATRTSALRQEHARRGAERAPGNLPAPVAGMVATSLVSEVSALIADHAVVALTGPPGVGKSRLALEVAHAAAGDVEGGVWLIDTTAARNESGLRDDVQKVIGDGSVGLLVLDGVDHVTDALGDFLSNAPCERALVTSRAAIPSGAVHHVRVTPLSDSDAVELLLRCAAANGIDVDADADRAPLAEICRRVDRLPLGIELAAARLRALPPAQLVDRLDDPLRVLGGRSKTAAPHHQSMKGAIEWTASRLSETEREALRDFAESRVVARDLLSALASKGFLEPNENGPGDGAEPEFRMLHVIRAWVSGS